MPFFQTLASGCKSAMESKFCKQKCIMDASMKHGNGSCGLVWLKMYIYIYILIFLLRLCVSDALWVTTASLSLLCDITRCYYKMKCGEAWCSLSCVIFAHLEREWRTSSEAFSRRKCRNHFGAGWTSSVGTATTLQAPASSFWSWSLDALAVCPLSPTVGIMNDEEWRRSCKLPACS